MKKVITIRALEKFSLLVSVTNGYTLQPVALSRVLYGCLGCKCVEQLTLALRGGSAQGKAPALALLEIMPMAYNILHVCAEMATYTMNYERRN